MPSTACNLICNHSPWAGWRTLLPSRQRPKSLEYWKETLVKHIRNKSFAVLIAAALLLVPCLSQAQFSGVVFDPTNYKNALLRYIQLQQQLTQLIETYQQVWNHYQLALRM